MIIRLTPACAELRMNLFLTPGLFLTGNLVQCIVKKKTINNIVMKRLLFVVGMIAILGISCNQNGNTGDMENGNLVMQQDDGTVLLELDKAECYSDEADPSSNTAEWNFAIEKAGRYKIWLSSATKDTLNLGYTHKIKVNLQDNQLDIKPEYNKIIQDSDEVDYPYYQADSYMGTFYIPEPGEYIIQIISELVVSEESGAKLAGLSDDIRLMSLVLSPSAR